MLLRALVINKDSLFVNRLLGGAGGLDHRLDYSCYNHLRDASDNINLSHSKCKAGLVLGWEYASN